MNIPRFLTRKILIIGALALVLPVGQAHAACPNIEGDWAVTYDENLSGQTVAGVGIVSFDAVRGVYTGFETYLGAFSKGTLSGRYTVTNACRIRWAWHSSTSDAEGTAHGVIVNADKLYFIFSNPVWGESGRAIAERMK